MLFKEAIPTFPADEHLRKLYYYELGGTTSARKSSADNLSIC